MNKKLVVITFDALQNDDLDFLLSRPNFKKIADKLAVVKNLKEIYPTLTYPIHTTMVTGRVPEENITNVRIYIHMAMISALWGKIGIGNTVKSNAKPFN